MKYPVSIIFAFFLAVSLSHAAAQRELPLAEMADSIRISVNDSDLDEAERARAAFRLEMALKNRPGTIAADFQIITREGKETSFLKTLKKGDNIVLFYDPDCNHCAEVIQYLLDTPALSKANVIAVDSEEDRYLWDATKSQLPENWTVAYSLDPIQDTELYVFPEMPTIYILNQDGTVIMKEATIENLINRLQ